MDARSLDFRHFEDEHAVRQENPVAHGHLRRQAVVVDMGHGRRAGARLRRQDKFMAVVQFGFAAFKETQAHFRPLRVTDHGHGLADGFRRRAHPIQALLMAFVVPVGKVEAGQVHAGPNHVL